MTEQELNDQLKKIREERAQKCLDEINEILKKHNCTIVVSPQVVINGQLAVAQVIAQ